MGEQRGEGILAGTVAVAAACLFWAFNYIPTTVAVREIDPLALLLVRLVFTVPLCLLALLARRESPRSLLPYWRQGLPLALLAVTGDMLLFQFALKYTTPAHAALVYVLIPIFAAIMAFLLIGERIGPSRVVGIGIAFVGAVILVSEDGITFESRYLLGDLLMLGAAFCWALYVVLSKPLVERIGAMRTITLVLALGLPLALPLTIVPAIVQPWHRVSPLAFASVAYIVLGGTFAAYVCYQFALKKLPASLVAMSAYVMPILVAVFSVLLLGETLSLVFFGSAALIFAGLLIARAR